MNKAEELVQRMLSFGSPGSMPFDGYPGMSDADVALIQSATRMHSSSEFHCPVVFMCWLASEHAKTREQYESARAYIDEYVQNAWFCNMAEGGNPIYAQVCEGEEGA